MAKSSAATTSEIIERPDGKSVVLRRNVEHPGTPCKTIAGATKGKEIARKALARFGSSGKFSFEIRKIPSHLKPQKPADKGSIRFFCDVGNVSRPLRHS